MDAAKDSPKSRPRGLSVTDWERVQVKTFQNWVNSQLAQRQMKLNDLITDLQDGVFLSELLEIISGKVIPHKKAGADLDLRHKKIDNLSNAMKFVSELYKEAGLKVETSAEDIADCRCVPILGMIWVIILKFAVSSFHDKSRAAASTGPVKLSTKDALLAWAQRNTAGHAGVNIQNFSMSWRDGLALCALVHFLDPTLIPFSSLKAENAALNIELALTISEQRLGVARLFDPSDCLDISRPDEKSIMTYVAIWREATTKYRAGSVFRVSDVDDSDIQESVVVCIRCSAYTCCALSITRNSFVICCLVTENCPRREGAHTGCAAQG
jgi:hypothetical protein